MRPLQQLAETVAHPAGTTGRRRGRALLAALTFALLGSVALSGSGSTDARWFTSVSTDLPDGRSDVFGMNAVNVDAPWGTVRNQPRVDLTTTATRHSGAPTVTSSSVRAGPWADSSTLVPRITVTGYRLALAGAGCSPDAPLLAGQFVAPGQTRALCPIISTPSVTDTQLMLQHGGRSVILASQVELRSADPATWSTPSSTVDSAARVTFPRPTPRNNSLTSLSNSCVTVPTVLLPGAELRWAWPDAGTFATPTTTPAVHRFQLYRRVQPTDPWSFYAEVPRTSRSLVVPSSQLGDAQPPLDYGYEWRIIAYPRPGTTAFAQSSHLIRTRQRLTGLGSTCVSAVANPATPAVGGFP